MSRWEARRTTGDDRASLGEGTRLTYEGVILPPLLTFCLDAKEGDT